MRVDDASDSPWCAPTGRNTFHTPRTARVMYRYPQRCGYPEGVTRVWLGGVRSRARRPMSRAPGCLNNFIGLALRGNGVRHSKWLSFEA
jgi:hypothetical protein